MSNTCFIKQFKGIVDNNSLKKFKVLRINVTKKNSTDQYAQHIFIGGSNLVCVAGGNIKFGTTYESENLGTETTETNFFFTNEDGYIEIHNKYNLTQVTFAGNTSATFSLDDLKYCDNITQIASNFGNLVVTGNLDSIKGMTGLTKLKIGYSFYVYGTMRKLGEYFPVLTDINIRYTNNITGTIEDMVEGMCTVGSSRTVSLDDRTHKLHGIIYSSVSSISIAVSASGAVVTVTGKGTASYDKTTGIWDYSNLQNP